MNIFEIASRKKYRFRTPVGLLTVEDLWSLPLTSKVKANLDDVARVISRELKETDEESFVKIKSGNAATQELEQKLDIVKHIIGYKLALKERSDKAAKTKAEKERLLSILDRKENAELEGMSKEDILSKLASLDG